MLAGKLFTSFTIILSDADSAGLGSIGNRLLIDASDVSLNKQPALWACQSGAYGHYEIDFAENGQKVVEMWKNGKYGLILMDVQMPIMNGFEATIAIRKKVRVSGDHIPIIAMTGHAFKEDENGCLDAGMDDYISKPIDFNACLQLISDNIKGNVCSNCLVSV